MTVTPLPRVATPPPEIDGPLDIPPAVPSAAPFGGLVAQAVSAAAGNLQRADAAERAFAAGRGGLQEMMLERAQADVALSVASAAASHAAQALTTILGMQV